MDITCIPILNYHKIEASPDIGITSRTPADFENDIKLFSDAGYRFISFKDLKTKQICAEKSIILTFDDGYESVYQTARSILRRYSATACIFIPSNYIGKYNDWDVQFGNHKYKHLNQSQIAELIKEGFEIGAHGLSHRSLIHIKPEKARYEIQAAKKRLESLFKVPVSAICYPFRKFNKNILKMVKQAGYEYGIASQSLRNVPPELQIFALPRINVYRYDHAEKIMKRVKNMHRFRYRNWLIQRGASATILYQKLFKRKEERTIGNTSPTGGLYANL